MFGFVIRNNKKAICALIVFIITFMCYVSVSAKEDNGLEELKIHYLKASQIYNWYTGYLDTLELYDGYPEDFTLVEYPEEVPKTQVYYSDGNPHVLSIVCYEEINTSEKMRSYLSRFFTETMVDDLMSREFPFVEFNGYLYYLSGHVHTRSVNGLLPTGYQIISKNKDTIVFRVEFEMNRVLQYIEPGTTYDYIVKKTDNGDYIFTNYIPFGEFDLYGTPPNPQTSDADIITVIAVAALPVFAAVIYNKKRKAV